MKSKLSSGNNNNMKVVRGFTLIELMVTLVVAVILIFVAVPSFGAFVRNNQLTSQANSLFTSLQLARSEALKRNAKVSICSSSNGTTCASSSNWHTGWIVFTDSSGTSGVLDSSDELLRTQKELSGSSTLSSGGETNIQFISSGRRSDYGSSSATDVTFTLTHPECTGAQKRVIVVSPMGRVEVDRQDC